MRDNQVLLQFLALIRADDDIAELAEARRNTVDHLFLGDQIIDNFPGSQNRLPALRRELHDRVFPADRNNLLHGQILPGNQNLLHLSMSSCLQNCVLSAIFSSTVYRIPVKKASIYVFLGKHL